MTYNGGATQRLLDIEQFKRRINRNDPVANIYRNAIDLNRYSNSVARRLINAYNDIIIDSVNQLRTIDDLAAPVKAARLRGILAQLKDSLATWAGNSTELTATELQGLAELQSEFVTDQLRKVLPAGSRDAVRTVEISPQFAQSVVTQRNST
jgi:hypothetical protein